MNNFRWCETITAMSSGSRVQISRFWMSLWSNQGWSSALWDSQGAFKEDLLQLVPVLLMFVPMKRILKVKINTQGPKKIRSFFHHTFIPNTSNYILFRTNCAIHWPLSYCARRWIGHDYKTKKKEKTHHSQEVHQLNWLLTTNTKSQAIGGDILPNLMPISVKFTLRSSGSQAKHKNIIRFRLPMEMIKNHSLMERLCPERKVHPGANYFAQSDELLRFLLFFTCKKHIKCGFV